MTSFTLLAKKKVFSHIICHRRQVTYIRTVPSLWIMLTVSLLSLKSYQYLKHRQALQLISFSITVVTAHLAAVPLQRWSSKLMHTGVKYNERSRTVQLIQSNACSYQTTKWGVINIEAVISEPERLTYCCNPITNKKQAGLHNTVSDLATLKLWKTPDYRTNHHS